MSTFSALPVVGSFQSLLRVSLQSVHLTPAGKVGSIQVNTVVWHRAPEITAMRLLSSLLYTESASATG